MSEQEHKKAAPKRKRVKKNPPTKEEQLLMLKTKLEEVTKDVNDLKTDYARIQSQKWLILDQIIADEIEDGEEDIEEINSQITSLNQAEM